MIFPESARPGKLPGKPGKHGLTWKTVPGNMGNSPSRTKAGQAGIFYDQWGKGHLPPITHPRYPPPYHSLSGPLSFRSSVFAPLTMSGRDGRFISLHGSGIGKSQQCPPCPRLAVGLFVPNGQPCIQEPAPIFARCAQPIPNPYPHPSPPHTPTNTFTLTPHPVPIPTPLPTPTPISTQPTSHTRTLCLYPYPCPHPRPESGHG